MAFFQKLRYILPTLGGCEMTDFILKNSWVLAPAFIVVLVLVVWARKTLAGEYEIKPIDAGIALIPFVLWMASAGILKSVDVAGLVKIDVGDVFAKAARKPIDLHTRELPIKEIKAPEKQGARVIPKMIAEGREGLSFTLGYHHYDGRVVWKYMNNLSQSPKFQYVVIKEKNDDLFGLYDVSRLVGAMNPPNNDKLSVEFPLEPFHNYPSRSAVQGWVDFAEAIRNKELDSLRGLAGFIGVDKAVDRAQDKKKVLEQMEALDVSWLPVVEKSNGGKKLYGIVDRARLTASLIIDVTNQLDSARKEE